MKCPVCSKEKIGEYFHVLSVDIDQHKFNYCCSDCLAEHLKIPRHIKFKFTDEDREEIRKIVREELGRRITSASF